jgi:signal transduction histidine kinase
MKDWNLPFNYLLKWIKMNTFLKIMLFIMLPAVALGQQYAWYISIDEKGHDSVEDALKGNISDTARMLAYHELGFYFHGLDQDSCYIYFNKELVLARKFSFKIWEIDALDNSAWAIWRQGNSPEALQRFLEGIKIAEDPASEKNAWNMARFDAAKDPKIARLVVLAGLYFDLATLYEHTRESEKEFAYLSKGEKVGIENHDEAALVEINLQFGSYYLSHHQIDSAVARLQKSVDFAEQSGFQFFEGDALDSMGNAFVIKGNYPAAKNSYLRSVQVNREQPNYPGLTKTYLCMAALFIKQNNIDSGLDYAKKGLALTKITNDLSDKATVYSFLSTVFKMKNNIDSAFIYQEMALAARDSLNNAEKQRQFENIGFNEQLRVQQLEEEKVAIHNKIRIYSMLAGLGAVLFIALILYRNNRQKKKANVVLQHQKEKVEETLGELNIANEQLENKNRDLEIEAALEKVRTRTMAMQRSTELADVATVLFLQVKALGVPQWTCGFCIWDKDDKEFIWYPGSDDAMILEPSRVPLTEHQIFRNWVESKRRGDELYIYEKEGEVQADHYRYMMTVPGLRESLQAMLDAGLTFPTFQIDHLANFAYGSLLFITYEPFPEMHDVFKRFAKVFEQTYRRFLDLQKAEAQAREAVKQAALDRIRADIASMRTVGDLDRITPLIWNELTTLGVPFIRCGIFIMNDAQKLSHTFLSTPDGKAIAAFHLPYNTSGRFADVVNHWQQKTMYVNHWDRSEFANLADTLVQQGAITGRDQYLSTLPPQGIYLHCLPFLQGMLYVGNTTRLAEEQIELIQAVADAFSTAYARYEDFNKLEAAKQQIEQTLTELKQAQTQLIQSEKMASLGELTAGIAHEIQNPLNFVNNFSEVNKEMLEELRAERLKPKTERDEQTEDDIINDVIANEEKINLHGKRADSIVKGMLQHSRASSGQRELTDINKLADEYLRLSYHGMRARDKSFNAEFKADFDESIGKINVVPQDIGRVLLNLYNNAFYEAPRPKGGIKDADDNHQHSVWVSTKKLDNKILISVRDNGNGIPQNIVDKIFQPFFTTKPTGQGTGLGLSLAYDIIKAHGGEIKVETKEGEGSEFIIHLPTS